MAHLVWLDDAGERHAITLGERDIVVGRSPECDVIIGKGFVSRRHCRVFRTEQGWSVADLGSTAGTFLNRIRIGDASPLAPGDRVQAGPEHLVTFESGAAPSERPRPVVGGIGGVVPALTEFEQTGDVPKPGGDDAEEILSAHSIESSEFMEALREAKSIDLRQLASKPATGGSHLAALVRVSETLRKCEDVPAVCRAALELAMQATGAGRGVIALRSADGQTFDRILERGGSGEALRISATFVDKMVSERMALIATDASTELAASRSVVAAKIRSILAAPLWDGEEILGYLYLDTTDGAALVRLFAKDDLNLIVAICHQTGAEIGRHRLGARIRDEELRRRNLARFVSADVIKHIEQESANGEDFSFTAKEQEVTILFADLQGFTAMAERMKPSDIKLLLDDYFDRMTDILVDRHGGTLDKYIGDAIMALFGAPFSQGVSVDARHAVAAAVEMRDTVEALRKKRRVYADVHVRIGINTGRVVAGMLGSQRRLEYSVIGDVVNVASRLEAAGEPGRIQIGEATYEAVKDVFECEFAGERKVKNRAMPIKSWWVTAAR